MRTNTGTRIAALWIVVAFAMACGKTRKEPPGATTPVPTSAAQPQPRVPGSWSLFGTRGENAETIMRPMARGEPCLPQGFECTGSVHANYATGDFECAEVGSPMPADRIPPLRAMPCNRSLRCLPDGTDEARMPPICVPADAGPGRAEDSKSLHSACPCPPWLTCTAVLASSKCVLPGTGPTKCLSAGTRIETPSGPIAVERIAVGDVVWTMNDRGERVAAPVVAASNVGTLPGEHVIQRTTLSDGRVVDASPGHPALDGAPLAELVRGDRYDGAVVLSVERMHYAYDATYDLLPAGATGQYWANGVRMGSTLRR